MLSQKAEEAESVMHASKMRRTESGYSVTQADIVDDHSHAYQPQPSRKSKKKRHRTTPEQLRVLEEVFEYEKTPDLQLRQRLARQLNMTPRRVQVWFQNKRAKEKRMNAKKSKQKVNRNQVPSTAGANLTSIMGGTSMNNMHYLPNPNVHLQIPENQTGTQNNVASGKPSIENLLH